MKRYIRPSARRRKALQRAERCSDLIMEYIVKIVVYHNVRREDVDEWIDNIATWLYDIDPIKLNYRREKLKPDDLMSTLFCCMGDELLDYRFELDIFQYRNKQNKLLTETKVSYPEVKTTYEITDELAWACKKLMRATIPLLCDKEEHSKREYIYELKRVFKPYL